MTVSSGTAQCTREAVALAHARYSCLDIPLEELEERVLLGSLETSPPSASATLRQEHWMSSCFRTACGKETRAVASITGLVLRTLPPGANTQHRGQSGTLAV
jgi:hypothetical protein